MTDGEPGDSVAGTSPDPAPGKTLGTATIGALVGVLAGAVGGRARLRVIALLASALALAAADQTVAGAVAPGLKAALEINNAQIGLLVTTASLVGAATTLPFGVLADRTMRVRLLIGCVLGWSGALIVAGAAQSFLMLLFAHVALGAGVGAATPVVASLTGDLIPAADRGRIFGFILAGEFAGAAAGLLIAGEIAAVWSWRGSFWVLAAPGPLLAFALWRWLPEPERGGASQLFSTSPAVAAQPEHRRASAAGSAGSPAPVSALHRALQAAAVQPVPRRVLDADPTGRPLRWAIRYVLSIPTNVAIIVASALVYFYVAGMQTFAIVFLRGRFDLGQGSATLLLVGIGAGVILGTLVTGPVSDRLIARGRIAARPVVGGVAALVAVVFFLPGFAMMSLLLAVPLLLLGAAAVGGANPPLDAARLDIMHSRLWGRAESVRMFVQALLKSGAPLLFGYLSIAFGDSAGGEQQQGGGAAGLGWTFLLMLVVLLAAGVILLVAARRSYPRDVATVLASERAIRG